MAIMAGVLLMGCATTSGTTVNKGTGNITVKDEKPWAGYAPTITPEYYVSNGWEIKNNLPERVISEQFKNEPIIGRITNNTDREYTFWLVHKFNKEYRPDYFMEMKVPAHSTRYFKSEVPEITTSFCIGVDTKKGKSITINAYNFNQLGSNDLAARCLMEIFRTHYVDCVFNGENESESYVNLIEPFDYKEEDLISNWKIR